MLQHIGLVQKNIVWGVYENDFGRQTIDAYYRLRELESHNTYIDAYNRENYPNKKK
jgi:hypothetical protein